MFRHKFFLTFSITLRMEQFMTQLVDHLRTVIFYMLADLFHYVSTLFRYMTHRKFGASKSGSPPFFGKLCGILVELQYKLTYMLHNKLQQKNLIQNKSLLSNIWSNSEKISIWGHHKLESYIIIQSFVTSKSTIDDVIQQTSILKTLSLT